MYIEKENFCTLLRFKIFFNWFYKFEIEIGNNGRKNLYLFAQFLGVNFFPTKNVVRYQILLVFQSQFAIKFGQFAIKPILIILDVPESSGPLLSRNRIYFPGWFHESSSNVGLDSEIVDFSIFSLKSLKCTRSENLDS